MEVVYRDVYFLSTAFMTYYQRMGAAERKGSVLVRHLHEYAAQEVQQDYNESNAFSVCGGHSTRFEITDWRQYTS